MNPRYNIALVPLDKSYGQLLTQTANRMFADTADGYLLGPQALPHATLCQFRASDDAAATRIFRQWEHHQREFELKADNFYLRPRKGPVAAFNAGIMLRKTFDTHQSHLFFHIREKGGEPLTEIGADYWPHFTMAYVPAAGAEINPAQIPARLLEGVMARPVLGLSDEAGQLLKILSPKF